MRRWDRLLFGERDIDWLTISTLLLLGQSNGEIDCPPHRQISKEEFQLVDT